MTNAAHGHPQNWDRESLLSSGDDMGRAFKRIAHEIVERNGEGCDIVLAGIPTRGVPMAARLGSILNDWGTARAAVLELAIEGHRDDRTVLVTRPPARGGESPAGRPVTASGRGPAGASTDVTDRVVVLVDDVIFHGRTARAALDALTELGRPAAVQLAVMVDRGHRELPIRADYVGKNVPTHIGDRIRVMFEEVDGVDAVFLVRDFE